MNTRVLKLIISFIGSLAGLAGLEGAWASPLRSNAGSYEVQVLSNGSPLRTFHHNGETYVLGHMHDRYTLRVVNRSARRIEAVVSVDGRDVIDGKPADFQRKRGYLVPAYGHVDIEGWRLSEGQVAAFRFSSVARSYAARTGSAREVGVIGVAVFPERYTPPVYVPRPRPHVLRPSYEDELGTLGDRDGGGRREESPSAESRAAPVEKSAPGASQGKADRAHGGAMVQREPPRSRPGLGTAFGEALDSPVQEVEFVRHNPYNPAVVLGVRYNDREGLLAMGIDVDGWRDRYSESYLRRSAEPFPVSNRPYATPPAGWEY